MKNKEKNLQNIWRNGKLSKKVLLIEDDLQMQKFISEYLKDYGFDCTAFAHPKDAIENFKHEENYEIIILDLMLPDMDGFDLFKKLKSIRNVPIIISSARGDIGNKIHGFELGADDYLPKPYDPRELEVRIKTILRRFNHSNIQEETSNKIFTLNEEKKEITKNGKYIKLTAAEFEVLSLLLKREGFIISREDIFDNSDILNQDYESSGSLAVIINRIRHKIEENPKEPQFLHTIRGMGYKFIQ